MADSGPGKATDKDSGIGTSAAAVTGARARLRLTGDRLGEVDPNLYTSLRLYPCVLLFVCLACVFSKKKKRKRKHEKKKENRNK